MATILIIDDNEQLRDTLRLVLSRDGHDITTASDGEAGIKAFMASPADLVITDIVMPGKEGLEILDELRSAEYPPKIIVISGGGGIKASCYLDIARSQGADGVLEKPIKLDMLRAMISDLLSSNAE